MPFFSRIQSQIAQAGNGRKPLYILSVVVFFWMIFDTILSYAIPILITQNGFSDSQMGIIIGMSSIAGCAFDFLLCRLVNNVNYRRVLLGMFAVSALYPLVLWEAKTLFMFLIGMVIWGIYWDLSNFGVLDYVSKHTNKEEFSSNFSLIETFKSLAKIIAPIIAGMLVVETVDWKTHAGSILFLFVGFLFLGVFFLMTKGREINRENIKKRTLKDHGVLGEIKLWGRIGKTISPALIIGLFLYAVDAFFWTIGPLYAETLNLGQFNGLLLMAFSLPSIMLGWFVSKLTDKYGKMKIACISLLAASGLLALFAPIAGRFPSLTIALTFLIACGIAISLPSVSSMYADYITAAPQIEKEVESVADFSYNIGYVIGPAMAGIMSDALGPEKTFSFVGIFGICLSLYLFYSTAKKQRRTNSTVVPDFIEN